MVDAVIVDPNKVEKFSVVTDKELA